MQTMVVGFGRGGRTRTPLTRPRLTPPGRALAHPAHLPRLALPGRVLDLLAVVAEAGDEPTHEVAGADVGDVLHRVRDVHHLVAAEHAELEVVEEQQFHGGLLFGRNGRTRGHASRAARVPAAPGRAHPTRAPGS